MTERDKYIEHYARTETNMSYFNPVEMSRQFGLNVSRLRTEQGFSQKELAKLTQISESQLVRIELNTVQRIDFVAALKLSYFFKVPLMSMVGAGNDLIMLYSTLIQSSARTQRLVHHILLADIEMKNKQSEYNSDDVITRICFGESIRDGINTTRFIYDHDNISQFKNYAWYNDAFVLLELNSNYYHPLYHMGDKLVIADRPPQNGEIGIFIKSNCLYIRKYIEYPGICRLEPLYRPGHDLTDFIVDRHSVTDMNEYIKFGTVVAII